jgi:hypothetical protein
MNGTRRKFFNWLFGSAAVALIGLPKAKALNAMNVLDAGDSRSLWRISWAEVPGVNGYNVYPSPSIDPPLCSTFEELEAKYGQPFVTAFAQMVEESNSILEDSSGWRVVAKIDTSAP